MPITTYKLQSMNHLMTTKNKTNSRLLTGAILASFMLAGSLQAQISFTVRDIRPGELTAQGPSIVFSDTTFTSVVSTATVPTATYTITGLDFTSVGGSANETVAFDIDYTFGGTGGTGVQINSFGNISVTGGESQRVDNEETITLTVGINPGLTTFTGDLSFGFIDFFVGDVSGGTDEIYDITTENGTQTITSPTNNTGAFTASSFVTLDPVAGDDQNGNLSVQRFDIQVTAIPEASAALLGGFVLLGLLIRRRSR